jgi:hypothetical protein
MARQATVNRKMSAGSANTTGQVGACEGLPSRHSTSRLTTNGGSSLPSMPARALRAVEIRHADRGFFAETGAVRAEDHVVEREQRVIVGRRLPVEHVEGGASGAASGQHRAAALIRDRGAGTAGALECAITARRGHGTGSTAPR